LNLKKKVTTCQILGVTRDKVQPCGKVPANGHYLDFNLVSTYVYLFQFSPCSICFNFVPIYFFFAK